MNMTKYGNSFTRLRIAAPINIKIGIKATYTAVQNQRWYRRYCFLADMSSGISLITFIFNSPP